MGLMDSTSVTKTLNRRREVFLNQTMTRKDMEFLIFTSGIPRNSSMFHLCLEYKIFETLGPNKYVFGQKPIYVGKVQNAYGAFMKKMRNYRK